MLMTQYTQVYSYVSRNKIVMMHNMTVYIAARLASSEDTQVYSYVSRNQTVTMHNMTVYIAARLASSEDKVH